MPGKSSVGGTDYLGLAYLLLVLAVAFGPMLVRRRPGPPDDSPDGGRDDGNEPRVPPAPPGTPTGGIPLPDAVPAATRLRGPSRLAGGAARRARRATEPPPKRRRVRSPEARRLSVTSRR